MKFFLSAFLVVFLAVFGLPSLSLAAPIIYTANLDGPSEDPPVPSNGTGFARVTIDTVADTLRVEVDFSDLVGDTTVAHIHAPTAVPFAGNVGVATTTPTFPGFPAGVTSGTYDQTFDTSLDSTYNAPFLAANGGTAAGAEAALAAALAQGRAYLNVHTTFRPGGEIRGFLTPLPASTLLFGTGLACLGGLRLRRKQC